jgi:hypothetical protein
MDEVSDNRFRARSSHFWVRDVISIVEIGRKSDKMNNFSKEFPYKMCEFTTTTIDTFSIC